MLDLFSGIGGFSLAAQWTGRIETVAFCEIEPYCQKILKKHWPDVPILPDIRTLNRWDVDGTIDIIAGGFPCKQTSRLASIHGGRVGLQGKDSGLWFEELRIIDDFRPTWAVIENPPGVKKWENQIETGLAGIGYQVQRFDLSSADIGAAHLRRRCFYVAYPFGQRSLFAQKKTANQNRASSAGCPWATTPPGVVRVAARLPHRVDRIRALGNSVDPRVAYIILEMICDLEEQNDHVYT
ncbi:MAG: DNA cytosine methyltransferase [Deltaproteobacteria bacterium]|nr:DNA cytosine methyltransferase [Deltaproteobacteria bacterium]